MDSRKVVPITLATVGLILFSGGVAAYYMRAGRSASCEACGMEVERTDPSTFTIHAPDGVVRYGCCPMCSLMIGIQLRDAVIIGRCFECGKDVKVNILNGNLSDVTPAGAPYSVSVILGESCVTRKIVCSVACAQRVKSRQGWASDLPAISLATAFQRAKERIPQFSIVPRQVRVPQTVCILVGLGAALLVTSPISWKFLHRRKEPQEDNEKLP